MNYLNSLAFCLRELITTTADSLARLSGFNQRQRILCGASVAQRLVFSWMANPRASLEYARRLQDALSESLQAVQGVLQRLQRHLQTLRKRTHRRRRPSTRDLLLNPKLAP